MDEHTSTEGNLVVKHWDQIRVVRFDPAAHGVSLRNQSLPGVQLFTAGAFVTVFDDNRRVLCVRRNYAPFNWTTPGGRIESGESPVAAAVRETLEETGYQVKITGLIGVYAATYKDDFVFSFSADVLSCSEWKPDSEIAEIGFFDPYNLPSPIAANTRLRIQDAADSVLGVLRVLEAA